MLQISWTKRSRARKRILLLILAPFFIPAALWAAPPLLTDPDRLQYPPLSFTLPTPERIRFDNGLVLYLLENQELPLVKISALIRTGTMYDPSGKEGLAELTGQVMKTGGCEGMTGDTVDERLESMAAHLGMSVSRDSGILSLSLLSKDTEQGIELFARIMQKPAFEEEKLSLAKSLNIGELRRIADDPQALAFREFGRLMHAGSSRGALAFQGSIMRIERDDLIRFHDLFYHPDRIMLSISGAIDRQQAVTLIARHFGSWKPSRKELVPPPLPRPEQGRIYFLPKEVPQSIIILGWLAPSKKEVRYHPMEIIDFIVGSGGFNSRLFQEIRTNRGLAYSTGSFYTARSEYGIFGAYAQTKSESTLEVISLMQKIFAETGEKRLPPKELERAQRAIVNSYIFSFTAVDQISLQQLMLEYDDLPTDFLMTFRKKIEKVRAADLQSLIKKTLDPGQAIILVLGSDSLGRQISESFKTVTRIEASGK